MTTLTLDSPKIGIGGEFRAVLRNPDESIAYDSGWGDNLITNLGLTMFSSLDGLVPFSYCYIGNSTAAPAVGQTTMPSLLASVAPSTQTPTNSTNVGTPNYERFATKTWRFGAGVGTGTIQDMGVGATSTSVGGLFARHLLTVPIDKGIGQSLDVSYRFTQWPSLIETELTGVLIGGVNYTCKTSMYNLTYANSNVFGEINAQTTSQTYRAVYNGVKAAPTATTPSGAFAYGTSTSNYDQAGAQADFSHFYGLTGGNTANNIIRTAIALIGTAQFRMQTEFTAEDGPGIGEGIPKDAEYELTLRWRLNWGRRP